LSLRVVGFEVIRGDKVLHLIFPFCLTIVDQPLIAQGDNTVVTSTGDDVLLSFVIVDCLPIRNHLLFHLHFGLFNRDTNRTYFHNARREPLLITQLLCLGQFSLIFMRLDLELFYLKRSRKVSHTLNFDNRYWGERGHPGLLNAQLLSQTLLLLQVLQHGVIIR